MCAQYCVLQKPGLTAALLAQRERILLVELLHAEYAHSHSTNIMRYLCVVIVRYRSRYRDAVGPGLNGGGRAVMAAVS